MADDANLHVRFFRPTGESRPAAFDAFSGELTDADRARALEFAREEDRVQSLVSRLLLRRTLSDVLGGDPASWRFVRGPHGKPELDPVHRERAHFNVTHTAGLVGVAVSTAGAVGLDAESGERAGDIVKVARRRFAEEEVEAMERLSEEDRRSRALLLWTLKESWLKAVGCGLTGTLRSCRFDVLREPGEEFEEGLVRARTDDEAPARFFVARPEGRWSLSLCCMRSDGEPLAVAMRNVESL